MAIIVIRFRGRPLLCRTLRQRRLTAIDLILPIGKIAVTLLGSLWRGGDRFRCRLWWRYGFGLRCDRKLLRRGTFGQRRGVLKPAMFAGGATDTTPINTEGGIRDDIARRAVWTDQDHAIT